MDNKALFKLSYGLFVLSAKEGEKDNGCIVNTVSQVTDSPLRISVTVNKLNYTCEMIGRTGEFTVSVLSQSAPFDLFKRFGFQSGRDADKFDGIKTLRGENGIPYLPENTTAMISGKVIQKIDLGTHIMFIADVTAAETLSSEESITYSYYQSNTKPKPPVVKTEKGWRCTICGYVYPGDELPPDFICPLCKHGASDFVRIDQ